MPQYDQGRQWIVGKRTNCSTNVSLGKGVSEVSRQSEDICTSISFSFPIPLYCLIFGPSEHSAVAFLTLISRSSLLTRLSHSVCVFVMQGGGISPQYCEVHTRTNHLISKHTQICCGTVIRRQSNRRSIPDLCLRLIRAAPLQIKHQLMPPYPRTELIMVVQGAEAQRSDHY